MDQDQTSETGDSAARRSLQDVVRPLMSLAEWNKRKADTHRAQTTYPKPNGIACPKCGTEMNDLNAMILASNPPQRNIGCPECGHRTYRMA